MGRTLGPADLTPSIVLELSMEVSHLITSPAAPPLLLVFVAGTSQCKARGRESQRLFSSDALPFVQSFISDAFMECR